MHLIASFRVLSGHEETVHDLLTDYGFELPEHTMADKFAGFQYISATLS